jgi:hypothetical protein
MTESEVLRFRHARLRNRRARRATTKRTCSSMPRTLWRWIPKLQTSSLFRSCQQRQARNPSECLGSASFGIALGPRAGFARRTSQFVRSPRIRKIRICREHSNLRAVLMGFGRCAHCLSPSPIIAEHIRREAHLNHAAAQSQWGAIQVTTQSRLQRRKE